MNDGTNARLAGVLSHIAAAGHTARHVKIETPDGEPMTLTVIDAGRRRAPNPVTTFDQGEQKTDKADSAERPTEWA
jgi:hypothetical protein